MQTFQTNAQLETALELLHRREMRLRSALSSALVSPENRQMAREELEALLEETRVVEEKMSNRSSER